jgi:hypothetical protein
MTMSADHERPQSARPVSPRLRKLEHFEHVLRRTVAGAALADTIDAHIEEVIALVNHDRRVAATWQRNQGPAFIRAVVDSGFDEDVAVPASIHGVSLESLLLRMADAIQRVGSPALRRAIAEQSLEILRWARECNSLQALFRRLELNDAGAVKPGD